MTAAQLETSLVVDVVICEYHHWTGASVIAHREWSRDKPDPGYQDQAAKRRMVNARLAGGSGGDDMPLNQQDLDAIAALLAPKASTADVNAARDSIFAAFRSEGISGAADHAHNGTNEILAAVAAIPPCNVQIDINALADRIVAAVGTDLASQVIDALGERIKPTSA